jgi:PhnB protein
MLSFSIYLNFPGTAEEAFAMYQSILGGEIVAKQTFREAGAADHLPENLKDKIMHIWLKVPNGPELMATDALEEMGQKVVAGNNMYISMNVASEADADRIFGALSADGAIEMPLQKTFWGAYFGIWKDKFGIQWMINYDYPKV